MPANPNYNAQQSRTKPAMKSKKVKKTKKSK